MASIPHIDSDGASVDEEICIRPIDERKQVEKQIEVESRSVRIWQIAVFATVRKRLPCRRDHWIDCQLSYASYYSRLLLLRLCLRASLFCSFGPKTEKNLKPRSVHVVDVRTV